MGIREQFGKKNAIIFAVALVAIAVIALIWSLWSNVTPTARDPGQAFTSDDGATFFSVSGRQISPIDKGGHPAYLAHLYTCSDKKKFVGWMEKYDDASRTILVRVNAATPGSPAARMNTQDMMTVGAGKFYKFPGEKDWVRYGDMALATISRHVTETHKCSDGSGPMQIDE